MKKEGDNITVLEMFLTVVAGLSIALVFALYFS